MQTILDYSELDLSSLVGQPYNGCWTLVRELYKGCFEIDLPGVNRVVDELDDWIHVMPGHQLFGDVLVFRDNPGKHVGFVIDHRKMIHATSTKDTVIEDYTGLIWKDRLQSIYRHKILA